MTAYTEPPLTIADLEATPDDGNRYELIDGELYVSTSPSTFHQSVLTNILVPMHIYLRQNPIGKVYPGVGIVFDDFNGVIPDLVYLSNARYEQTWANGKFTGSPELVIEILSPGIANERRDRHVKRNLYSSRGAHEYWIVDPEKRSMEIHRKRKQGGLEFALILQAEDELTTTLLPGFTIPVEAVFTELSR
jgi:Uma2 family endonuclease